jgi:hypothetical protein
MDKSSDATPEPDITADGSLEPGSTANGDPESHDAEERPEAAASPSDPDSLIEGNRVATAEDME